MTKNKKDQKLRNKYHFGDGKAKAMKYFDLIMQYYKNSHVSVIEIFQKKKKLNKNECSRSRYQNMSHEKKRKRKEYLRNYNFIKLL